MKSERELSNQYGAAAPGLAATAGANALGALRALTQDETALAAMRRIHQLGEQTRRIQLSLETGEKAFENGDVGSANLEWASALVLMDALSVETAGFVDQKLVAEAVDLQKSGKTA